MISGGVTCWCAQASGKAIACNSVVPFYCVVSRHAFPITGVCSRVTAVSGLRFLPLPLADDERRGRGRSDYVSTRVIRCECVTKAKQPLTVSPPLNGPLVLCLAGTGFDVCGNNSRIFSSFSLLPVSFTQSLATAIHRVFKAAIVGL